MNHAAPRIAPPDHANERAARAFAGPHGIGHRRRIAGPLALGDGQALPGAERAHFEQLFGQDFSAVRVHADGGGMRLARELHARAFTSGTDVAFAAGRWQPGTPRGRALLAHELVHVAQVQAAGADSEAATTIWRAGEDEPMPDQPPTPELSVEVTTSTSEAPIFLHNLNEPDQAIDETGSPVYEGDIVALRLVDGDGNELGIEAEALPEGLERSDASTPGRLLLRVRAPADAVSVRVRDPAASGISAVVTLRLQPRPAPHGTVDPAWAALEADRAALAAKRRSSRSARRSERQLLRGADPGQRRAARRARREQRRDERSRARELRRARAAYLDRTPCSPEVQKAVDAAQRRGVQVCDAAMRALSATPAPDAAALAALSTYLKIDAAAEDAKPNVRSVIDVLSTARNGLAAADFADFVCGPCDETTGAFVTQHVRGGRVTLCPLWRTGTGLHFDPARGVDEARAYALVHEFVHLSGPSVDDERYVGDKAGWAALTPQQALHMADAYAALAWAAGSAR